MRSLRAQGAHWPMGSIRGSTCRASMSASTTCSICARMCASAISSLLRSLHTSCFLSWLQEMAAYVPIANTVTGGLARNRPVSPRCAADLSCMMMPEGIQTMSCEAEVACMAYNEQTQHHKLLLLRHCCGSFQPGSLNGCRLQSWSDLSTIPDLLCHA